MKEEIMKNSEFEKYLNQARELLKQKGLESLRNPHAMTGRICRCNNCLCCAALQVYSENRFDYMVAYGLDRRLINKI